MSRPLNSDGNCRNSSVLQLVTPNLFKTHVRTDKWYRNQVKLNLCNIFPIMHLKMKLVHYMYNPVTNILRQGIHVQMKTTTQSYPYCTDVVVLFVCFFVNWSLKNKCKTYWLCYRNCDLKLVYDTNTKDQFIKLKWPLTEQ